MLRNTIKQTQNRNTRNITKKTNECKRTIKKNQSRTKQNITRTTKTKNVQLCDINKRRKRKNILTKPKRKKTNRLHQKRKTKNIRIHGPPHKSRLSQKM